MNIWPDNKTKEPPLTFAGMPPEDWLKDEKKNKIADHQIRQYSPYDHTKDTFLILHEPPKTGWDLYITPEFTLNNIKPVNWFNRKMQELILGFKWKRQKNQ